MSGLLLIFRGGYGSSDPALDVLAASGSMAAVCRRAASFVVVFLLWSLSAFGATWSVCPIPLAKGNVWTYTATVSWTPVNSAALGPERLRWQMTVLEVLTNGPVRAAIVRGLPDELAWYERGMKPGYSVILYVGDAGNAGFESPEPQWREIWG